jgi:hypothetical protein
MGITFGSAPTSGNLYLYQRIEDVRTLSGKQATETCYVNNNLASCAFQQNLVQNFGSGGSPTVATSGASIAALPSAGAFNRYDQVLTVPSIVTKTIGTNSHLDNQMLFTPRSTGTIYVAHVSLCEGDVSGLADPFTPKTDAAEDAACARFAQPFPLTAIVAYQGAGSVFRHTVSVPTMRAMPTITQPAYSYSNANSGLIGALSTSTIQIQATAIGAGQVQIDTNTAGYLDAEIY